jgi:glycosyltransferase involved in cell wall biosynthesis
VKVWLITLGEPLPIDGPHSRLLRTGFLARALRLRGHDVSWFTNRFDHFSKTHRQGPAIRETAPNERLILLDSRGYVSNVSIARYLDHRDLVREFKRYAAILPRPDVVVASIPTVDLCEAAVSFASEQGIPAVVDIRDLWPDSFWDLVPRILRPVAKASTLVMERQVRRALRRATAVTSHVDSFLHWAKQKLSTTAVTESRVFPLGYEATSADDTALNDAREFWKQRGVGTTNGEFIAVYVGTISRQCEFGHVVAAARALSDEGVKFVLCGSGDTLSGLTREAERAKNIVVPGWCTHAQISVLLENANAGLMPYRRLENFVNAIPNKALEYMACGVPVVWSLQDGVLANLLEKEQVGVTYDFSADGLVSALRTLRDRNQRDANAARGRRLFEERFQAASIYDSMARFLESLGRAQPLAFTDAPSEIC